MTTTTAPVSSGLWMKIQASHEQYRDQSATLDGLKGEATAAKSSLNEAEESLSEAIDEANRGDAEEEIARVMRLHEDVKRRTEQWNTLDRKKRSQGDTVRKLLDRVLTLLDEARDPTLFETYGEGINAVELRDLIGGPGRNADDDAEWASRPLERIGARSVVDYCKRRRVEIPVEIQENGLSAELVERVDRAVWLFLLARDATDLWPKGVAVPEGVQLPLRSGEADEDDDEQDDE